MWERTLRVNLYGTFYLTRAFSMAMKDNVFGRIVNFASQAAYQTPEELSPYAGQPKLGLLAIRVLLPLRWLPTVSRSMR